MCKVASCLGENVQIEFSRWFIDHQLSEYAVLYGESENIAWIDKIDLRFRLDYYYGNFRFKTIKIPVKATAFLLSRSRKIVRRILNFVPGFFIFIILKV